MMSNSDSIAFKHTELAADGAAYIESLYEQYKEDKNSVDEHWQAYFADYEQDNDAPHNAIKEQFLLLARNQSSGMLPKVTAEGESNPKHMAVARLILAYRRLGHRKAKLDPLGLQVRTVPRSLSLAYHGLSDADLDSTFSVADLPMGKPQATLREIIEVLERIYCGSIGVEYMHAYTTAEREWFREYLEKDQGYIRFDKSKKLEILERLTAAEGLEKYLARKYTGVKRFGLEGGESFIPAMHEIIQRAGANHTEEMVIGMAHRGRLNVLVNILGKNPKDLFDEFDGKVQPTQGSGDVKYHNGYSSNVMTAGGEAHLALAFNPSHLEIVSPVLIGSVRARQARRSNDYAFATNSVLPIVVHGDAALAGQGVNQETFQMSQTRAYKVGGTLHIVINNQVGFTTSRPDDARSTEYCTDVARMVHAPVLHVNGDDPEAVVFAAQMALDYRREFGRDVVVDIVCYRRNGHNESDEPSATQPLMYSIIKKLPSTRTQYADKLVKEGVLTAEAAAQMEEEYRLSLDRGDYVANGLVRKPNPALFVDWTPYLGHGLDDSYETGVAIDKLKAYGESMAKIPEGFALQRQVAKVIEQRLAMQTGQEPLNWGAAETLAYASLVDEGKLVRITGEDVGRGTFSHRHSELFNVNDGSMYIPLQHISPNQARFATYNSLLSEEAVLAFEYGYATTIPNALIIWEAQFGDFANGAQVVIDQFISSGETKWQRLCGLTMLLPHGFEGQGPEHSSARLERFLQLCAEDNMQVITPTTPAQIFHALRRQVVRPTRKPLIVMSPKSLLRHPQATSTLEELGVGTKFETVLGEVDTQDTSNVERVVLCGGKVYYELLDARRKLGLDKVAIVRIEQLYPFPESRVLAELAKYPAASTLVWAQEEPLNQGAWYYLAPELYRAVVPATGAKLLVSARPAAAAPATGSPKIHAAQQAKVVADALGVGVENL
ncbi:MAG: 2-oxoglutarate dehydrogenase E1 component [Moraxella sp.]|nr:2-oxoglutarate dehydrogenase E1 component [Moraxella sp.]